MGCAVLQIGRASTGIRVWFIVQNADGSLRTGLVAGNFTVTIIRDDDAANTTAAVSESTQVPGVYFFDVPTVFLTTNGNQYAMLIQVTAAPLDALLAPLLVTRELWDQLAGATFTEATDSQEAIRDRGDTAWVTATGFAVPGDEMDLVADAVDASAVATSGADEIRDAILADSTPFNGADIAAILVDTGTDIPGRFTGIEGATFNTTTDSLEAIRNRGDAAWITATTVTIDSASVDLIWNETFAGHITVDSFAVLVRDMWRRLNLDDANDVVHTDATDSSPGSIVVGVGPVLISITLTKAGPIITTKRTV